MTSPSLIHRVLLKIDGKEFAQLLKNQGLMEDENKRHLLLMDTHNLHTFNYQFLKLMNNNNIVVLAFPAHTTHVMQPLNDMTFAQLKTAWYKAMWLHVRSVCAKKLSKGDVFKIFIPCWKKAITVQNIQAGFRHTGVWPVDRSAITDANWALHCMEMHLVVRLILWCWLNFTWLSFASGLLKLFHVPFPTLIVLNYKLQIIFFL